MRADAFAGQRLSAVLFDIDGVLLDTGSFYRRIWSSWAKACCLDPGWVVAHTHGRRTDDTLREVAPQLDPGPQRLALDELVRARISQVRPMPGARALLRSLNAAGAPWALVSSGSQWFARQCFDAGGLPLPAVQVYGEDVRHGKPAPEGYLAAARLLGVRPGSCAVVEDSPGGVTAGKRAGCMVLAVSSTHEAAQLGDADACVPTLADAARVIQLALGTAVRPATAAGRAAVAQARAEGDSS